MLSDSERAKRDAKKRILNLKRNPSCTTHCKQEVDLSDAMPKMNRLEKTTTLNGEVTPLLDAVNDRFCKLRNKYSLNLPARKQKVIADYLAQWPIMAYQSYQGKKLKVGFYRNGMVDRVSNKFPDMKVMIQDTLGRLVKESEWKLCCTTFPSLWKIMDKQGAITTKEFVSLGYPAPEFE